MTSLYRNIYDKIVLHAFMTFINVSTPFKRQTIKLQNYSPTNVNQSCCQPITKNVSIFIANAIFFAVFNLTDWLARTDVDGDRPIT